jgi:hypothetical protein
MAGQGIARGHDGDSGTALALPILLFHEGSTMEDTRCCGSGTCIINAEGLCWCGQRWDGTRMCAPEPLQPAAAGEGDGSKGIPVPTATDTGQAR